MCIYIGINNIINSLNEVFYSKDEELYGKILENWKIIFKPNG